MADELVDVVNEQGEVLEQRLKSECHSDSSLIHPTAICFVFNEKGEVLLQKRAEDKRNYPGYWAGSVAGHLAAGEGPEEGIRREAMEELGRDLGKIHFLDKQVIRHSRESELIHFFVSFDGLDISEYSPDLEEVPELRYFDLEELMGKIYDGEIEIAPGVVKWMFPKIFKKLLKVKAFDKLS